MPTETTRMKEESTPIQTTTWQRVPRTLTPEMRDAFWRNMTQDVEDGKQSAADECWADMLAAAQRWNPF